MAKTYALGAPYVLIGDPTQASGAGLFDLGLVPGATVTINQSKTRARDVGGIPRAEGAFDRGVRAEITIRLYDVQAEVMQNLISAATERTDGTGFSTTYRRQSAPPTLIVVPNGEEGDAVNSDRVWYMPAADSDGPIEILYDEGSEGNEGNASWEITFVGLQRETDQADTALDEDQQMIFQGDPPAGWSFPAAYTAE